MTSFLAATLTALACLSVLTAYALTNEIVRSHLSESWQKALGQREPYAFDSPVAEVGIVPPRMIEGNWTRHGWTHESYIRSRGLDVDGVCREAHRSVPWIEGNWHWPEFYAWCSKYHSHDVVMHYGRYYEENVSDHCKGLIEDGWIVGDDGEFYPRGTRDAGLYPQFVKECLQGDASPFVYMRDYSVEEADRISARVAIRDLTDESTLIVPYRESS